MKNTFYYITFFCFIFNITYMNSLKIDSKAYKYSIKKQLFNKKSEILSKKEFYNSLNDRDNKIIKMKGRPDCPDGYIEDCSGDGDCCSESWIGDGFADCEDQAYGCDLTCYDNDGGDCDGGGSTTTTGGIDCYDNWISDGYCDDTNNNEECQWDGGDCCGSTCVSDTYDCGADADWAACNSECLDPDANDDCCYDNSCPFTCVGQGLIDCWDGSCAENESDCPEQTCLDTDCGNYIDDYTCPEIEQNFGYDCSLCEEEGLCPISCEDEGLVTCSNGECAYSEYDCNTCENPSEAVEGSNYSGGHDEYYSLTLEEGGFVTISSAGAGIDTKLFLYAQCDNVDIDNFPYGDYIAYNDDWGSSEFGDCPDCTYWGESYIYVGVPAGDYIIVSSDQYNYDNIPFEWLLSFEIGIEGCTNPFAENYNPEANIDDGSCEFGDNTFFVTCNNGTWQDEISWNLISSESGETILSGGAPYENLISLESGSYYVNAFDSFGDGWNDNYWTILDSQSNTIFSYTLEDGSEGMSDTFVIESESCFGDVNGDNTLNISDILIIINAIINQDTEDLLECGDMNNDNILNISDLIIIVDLILNY